MNLRTLIMGRGPDVVGGNREKFIMIESICQSMDLMSELYLPMVRSLFILCLFAGTICC